MTNMTTLRRTSAPRPASRHLITCSGTTIVRQELLLATPTTIPRRLPLQMCHWCHPPARPNSHPIPQTLCRPRHLSSSNLAPPKARPACTLNPPSRRHSPLVRVPPAPNRLEEAIELEQCQYPSKNNRRNEKKKNVFCVMYKDTVIIIDECLMFNDLIRNGLASKTIRKLVEVNLLDDSKC